MRLNRLQNARRIVIKIGTSSLTHATGKMDYRKIDAMARVVADLKNTGYELVVVSSGAIGVGLGKLNLSERPEETSAKQALAAIGQSSLVSIWDRCFSEYGCQAAQVLLTKSVLEEGSSRHNIVNAFDMMFQYGVIPIVNENDVVATDEIDSGGTFGDNDTLSAYVARLIEADLLVMWTDIDGLYDSDPWSSATARIIPTITEITEETYKMASGSNSWRGRGGMRTKLDAAAIAMAAGIDAVICNSNRPGDVYDILDGHSIGTLFHAPTGQGA